MSRFKYLFSPLQVRGYTYKNRIATAPTLFASSVFNPEIAENVYRMVENRAKGGAAAVSTGEICVNFEEGICVFATPFDYNQTEGETFDAYCEYARRIKQHGAIAMVEICHEGAEAPVKKGTAPWGPDNFTRKDGVEVLALDDAMMEKICADFKRAAKFMKAAGFDGILVHGGHGFLFQQFISPRTNHRNDQYGGSMVNRARFPVMILEALREAMGDMILELRFSAEDGVPGGMTIRDTVEFCKTIDGKVDIIHITNGIKSNRTHTFSDMYDEHGINVKHAAKVKAAVKLSKVAVIGGLNSPEYCDKVIEEGKADIVVLGRQSYADPDFANKAASGKEALIRRCVRCFQCYPGFQEHETDIPLEQMMSPEEVKKLMNPASMGRCAINPKANFRLYPERFPAPGAAKSVLVAGGGVSGMQAAITAAERGHKVVLAEKSPKLGGIINFTDYDKDKVDLYNFKETLIRELQELNIEVRTGCAADLEYIRRLRPDHVIIAAGSKPTAAEIEGMETAVNVLDAYRKLDTLGERVVMIGGGLAGCEAGVCFAGEGKSVTVIEMKNRLAPESYAMQRTALMDELGKRNVLGMTGYRCTRICSGGVWVIGQNAEEEFVEADTVIISLGMRPDTETADMLKEACGGIPYTIIGDCCSVGNVRDAVSSGYMAAMNIV